MEHDQTKAGITFSSAAEDFHIDDLAACQGDPATEHFGGVVTGMTGIFTVLLTAPCAEGATCSRSRFTTQRGVDSETTSGAKSRYSGTFSFSSLVDFAPERDIALAVLSGDCAGEELYCKASHTLRVGFDLELAESER